MCRKAGVEGEEDRGYGLRDSPRGVVGSQPVTREGGAEGPFYWKTGPSNGGGVHWMSRN